jgi:hypothetical protein
LTEASIGEPKINSLRDKISALRGICEECAELKIIREKNNFKRNL